MLHGRTTVRRRQFGTVAAAVAKVNQEKQALAEQQAAEDSAPKQEAAIPPTIESDEAKQAEVAEVAEKEHKTEKKKKDKATPAEEEGQTEGAPEVAGEKKTKEKKSKSKPAEEAPDDEANESQDKKKKRKAKAEKPETRKRKKTEETVEEATEDNDQSGRVSFESNCIASHFRFFFLIKS